MNHRTFFAEHFPLIVKCPGAGIEAPIQWFDRMGVAAVGRQYVVEVWPSEGNFTELGELRTYAYGWSGLAVRVVEHGVGELVTHHFQFEDYCQSREQVNSLYEEHHYVMKRRPLGIIRYIYDQPKNLRVMPKLPAWECEAPTAIETEFLTPIQAFLVEWMGGK